MTHLPPNVHLYPHTGYPSTIGDVHTVPGSNRAPIDYLKRCQWVVLILIFTAVAFISVMFRFIFTNPSQPFLDILFFIHLLIIAFSTFYFYHRLGTVNFRKQRFFGTVLLFVSWFICSLFPIVNRISIIWFIPRLFYPFMYLFLIFISFLIPFVALKLALRKAAETDLILGLTYGSVFGFALGNRWQLPFEVYGSPRFFSYRDDYVDVDIHGALVFSLLELSTLAAMIVMGMAFGLAVVIRRRKIGTRKHYINLFLFSIIPSCLLCFVVDELHFYVVIIYWYGYQYEPRVGGGYYLTSYFLIVVSCVYCYFMGMKLKLLMHKFQNEVEESITTNPMTTAKV
ncbi:hypothetical protein P9112_005880 [Eukaryota sp. TZLM1-RC]